MHYMDRKQAITQLTRPGEPYELISQSINGVPCRVFANAPATLADLYEQTCSDATFLVYANERYSFSEVHQRASRLATCLIEDFGINKGDRVAIAMRNYPEWIITFSAVTAIGGVAVAMNAWWQADEIAMGLADCGAKVIVADEERLRLLDGLGESAEIQQVQVIAVRPQQTTSHARFDDLISSRSHVSSMPVISVSADDAATIFYTSGSTGFPKGAVASQRNIISALMSWELDGHIAALRSGVTPAVSEQQAAVLLAVPLFHATGSHAVYLLSYRAQRKIVSMYKWDAQQAARLIEAEHISSFVAPAAMTGDLVSAAQRSNHDLSSLITVGGGGAPRAPEQVRDIDRAFRTAKPNTGWGMTETNAIGTGISGDDYLEHPESSGQASAIVDLKIINEAGQQVATGERGELLIRGTSVISGYWQRPEANAETFVDGWMHTGDVAYLDAEGFLYIVDRIKDLIIRGGENIGCGEVEAALLEHPGVLEASVYALPDPRLGEEVGATIYCPDALDQAELMDFLSARLAKFKLPQKICYSDQPLPRIASGKIFKRKIREDAIAAR